MTLCNVTTLTSISQDRLLTFPLALFDLRKSTQVMICLNGIIKRLRRGVSALGGEGQNEMKNYILASFYIYFVCFFN